MPLCLQPWSVSLQNFPPPFGPQVLLKIHFRPIWTAFQEGSLGPRKDTFRFKGIHIYRLWRPTWFLHMQYKKNSLENKVAISKASAFLPLCIEPLLRDSCLYFYGKNHLSPWRWAHMLYLLGSCFLSNNLPAALDFSLLIWLPQTTSKEDSGSWKCNLETGNWV